MYKPIFWHDSKTKIVKHSKISVPVRWGRGGDSLAGSLYLRRRVRSLSASFVLSRCSIRALKQGCWGLKKECVGYPASLPDIRQQNGSGTLLVQYLRGSAMPFKSFLPCSIQHTIHAYFSNKLTYLLFFLFFFVTWLYFCNGS